MRTFPRNSCPTGGALLAYVEGRADPKLRECIDAHAQECAECRESLQSLQEAMTATDVVAVEGQAGDPGGASTAVSPDGDASHAGHDARAFRADAFASIRDGFSAFVERHRPEATPQLRERLAEQRAVIARMLDQQYPPLELGQVWAVKTQSQIQSWCDRTISTTKARQQCGWSYPDASDFSFLVLVLSHHSSAADNSVFVNVAPVTDDERLAAEWSLVFEPQHSGIGGSAVIHLDLEQSASVECLHRYVGRLPEKAGEDLLCVAHAWSRSEAPPHTLSVGRLGQAAVRTRPDWQSFDAWISTTMRSVCGSQLIEDADQHQALDGADTVGGMAASGPTGSAQGPLAPRLVIATAERRPATRPLSAGASTPGAGMDGLLSEPMAAEQSTVADTFAQAVADLLADGYGGSLAQWSKQHGCNPALAWAELVPWQRYSVEHLVSAKASEWMRDFLAAGALSSQLRQQAVLKLAGQVYYRVTQQRGSLEGKGLSQRAARQQSPRTRSDDRPPGPRAKPNP